MIASPFFAEFSVNAFHIYSPSHNNESFKDGQNVILDFASPYKNVEFTINIDQIVNGTSKLYNSIAEFTNSSGGFYGPIMTGQQPLGEYEVIIEDPSNNSYASFYITLVPPYYEATILATVDSQNGTPISGATVTATYENGTVAAQGITSQNGQASLEVEYPDAPIVYNVTASANGYVKESTTVNVTSNGTFPVSFKLALAGVHVNLVGVFQGKAEVGEVVKEDQLTTLEYQVLYQGSPVAGVSLNVCIAGQGFKETLSNSTNSLGLVNVTFIPPLIGKATLSVNASATYQKETGYYLTTLTLSPVTVKVPIDVKVLQSNGSLLQSNVTLKYPNGTVVEREGSPVVFNVTYNGTSESFNVSASSLGFFTQSKTIEVNGTAPVDVTLTLLREYLNVTITVEQNGTTLTPPYSVVGGEPFTLLVNASVNGKPVPASLNETLSYPNGTTESKVYTLTSGYGNITLTLPKSNGTTSMILKLAYNGATQEEMLTVKSIVYPVTTTSSSSTTSSSTTAPSSNLALYGILALIIIIVIVLVVLVLFRRKPGSNQQT